MSLVPAAYLPFRRVLRRDPADLHPQRRVIPLPSSRSPAQLTGPARSRGAAGIPGTG